MKNYRLIIVILLVMVMSVSSGCWDRRELENLSLVQTLGLDRAPNGKGITVTVMIAVPPKIAGGSSGGGGGGGGSESGVMVLSQDAPSIYEAFNLINTTVNREVTLLQNQTLLIGEDLAKAGVKRWIDNLVRYREMRRTMLIFICKGKAVDIMKVKPKLEKNPGEYFSDLVRMTRRNGMFPLTNLQDFMNRYEAYAWENTAPLLGNFKRKTVEESGPGGKSQSTGEGGKPPEKPTDVRVMGTAVFRMDKLVGQLDLYESQVLQLITNNFREAYLTIADPLRKKNNIVFRLLKTSPTEIKYRHLRSGDHFLTKLNLEADLVSIQSRIDYTHRGKEHLLESHIAKSLEKRIMKVLDKAEHQYRSDIFGYGLKVRSSCLTTQEWDRVHWPEKFPEAKISVRVKVAIRRIGVQFGPPILR